MIVAVQLLRNNRVDLQETPIRRLANRGFYVFSSRELPFVKIIGCLANNFDKRNVDYSKQPASRAEYIRYLLLFGFDERI